MKFKNRRITAIILLLVLCTSMVVFASGCINKDKQELRYPETEYFRYHVFRSATGEEVVSIKGLTEKGKQLKNIVIPEEIEGKKVVSVIGAAETPNLKKIIVSYNVSRINSFGGRSQGSLFVINYPHWPKIIYVNCECKKSAVFPSIRGYLATNAEKSFSEHYHSLQGFSFANMQYLFNYEGAPNKGVSFVDDLETGEGIEIIPAIPKRDGYTFIGWYAEPECLNKIELNGYVKTDDEIVYLYAGWEENIK